MHDTVFKGPKRKEAVTMIVAMDKARWMGFQGCGNVDGAKDGARLWGSRILVPRITYT